MFSLRDFLVNLQLNSYKKIPPHLAYVASLPCETLTSAKQATNDKLQGRVATYLRCDGVVNNDIKKGLLLSVWVKTIFKSVNIWQSYKQEHGCLMHFAFLANTLLKDEEQEAQLSPRDRAMRRVSWNLANCHATVQYDKSWTNRSYEVGGLRWADV